MPRVCLKIFDHRRHAKIVTRYLEGAQLIRTAPTVTMHPAFTGKTHLLQFFGCNVVDTSALAIGTAVFHFAEIQRAGSFGNNINFTLSATPVLGDNSAASTR